MCALPSATAFVPSQTKTLGHTRAHAPRILSPTVLKSSSDVDETEKKTSAKIHSGVRPDSSLSFGSEEDNLEEDEEDYYEQQENEYQARREAIVNKALEEQDKQFKEERRREVWGEFADAKTPEEIEAVKQKLKEKIDKENEFKAKVAKQQGIDMEMLEAKESDGSFFDTDNEGMTKSMNRFGKSWHQSMDDELKEEWAAMGEGRSESLEGVGEDDSDDEEEEKDTSSITDDTVAVDGKIVTRDALKGVRVGSAGGWTLEVFPGDFVVHRKYGIGRFEKTCTTPRLKLTKEEIKARDERRKEILTEKLREAR